MYGMSIMIFIFGTDLAQIYSVVTMYHLSVRYSLQCVYLNQPSGPLNRIFKGDTSCGPLRCSLGQTHPLTSPPTRTT